MKEQLVTMSDEEELDRYRKLLDDWKPGNPRPQRPSEPPKPRQQPLNAYSSTPRPPAVGAPQGAGAANHTPPSVDQGLASGAVLLLNERTLAVYQRAVPEKEYHLVLVLTPSGTVKIQGLALQAHHYDELGKIPHQFVEQLQNEMRWDRDLIVFHCFTYEDARRVPHQIENGLADERPLATVSEPAPAPQRAPASQPPHTPPPATNAMPTRRGQRMQIKFGANMWDAMYWGKDAQGHVVAHQTYQKWALMHLDLDRFASTMVVDPNVDETLLAEVERQLLEEISK